MGKVSKALDKAAEAASSREELSAAPQVEGIEPVPTKTYKKKSRKKRTDPVPQPGGWDERLALATASPGAAAESFRTLRTRILHPVTGKAPRSLLITSAAPGEGKSFVCANLAVCLALGVDQYALLVDCDLRKPSLHTLFGLSNERGLVNHLRDKDKLESIIVNSGVNKLSLLPAGPSPMNPSELLSSGTMVSLVDELVDRHDDRIILLDSPPLQAASETAVLAQHVDGVVLVVRWGGSRREHVKSLVDTIGHEKIVGVVFNAYKATILDSKVFGYYEYQGKYQYGEK